jgi:2-polyprenyl-3-methyl-5-hydroxy-6-metoxy-1,4-benzoquinol methylase
MTWLYHDDPRPDIQALVPAGARRVLDVGCAGGALAAALKARGVLHLAGVEQLPRELAAVSTSWWKVTS